MARIRSVEMKKKKAPKVSEPVVFASALLALDAILVSLIIAFVPYTKIDWDAYMSQVDGFLGGERDYNELKGETGPLVYPAGFLYVYSAVKFIITGGQVFPAQILFGILYIVNLGIVFLIYIKTDLLPWWRSIPEAFPCGPNAYARGNVSKGFAVSLLAVHLTLLELFAHYKWSKHEGGLIQLVRTRLLDTAKVLLRPSVCFS